MTAYYNENEPFAAQWLRNLIEEDLIAPGHVDDRSIVDVRPDDLIGFNQCHFFAGLGGWSYALRLAGVDDRARIWTGSCPCQPFSAAGKREGFEDARHLWPHWFDLIRECRPSIIFGEQVARAAVWFDAVCTDLESVGYAVGAANIPACAVGAPHERTRLWFVADTDASRLQAPEQEDVRAAGRQDEGRATSERCWWSIEPGVGCVAYGVPGRVGKLRAFGNAIVPQVAAEFVRAYMG